MGDMEMIVNIMGPIKTKGGGKWGGGVGWFKHMSKEELVRYWVGIEWRGHIQGGGGYSSMIT